MVVFVCSRGVGSWVEGHFGLFGSFWRCRNKIGSVGSNCLHLLRVSRSLFWLEVTHTCLGFTMAGILWLGFHSINLMKTVHWCLLNYFIRVIIYTWQIYERGLVLKTNYQRGYLFKQFTMRVCFYGWRLVPSLKMTRKLGTWRVPLVLLAGHIHVGCAASSSSGMGN